MPWFLISPPFISGKMAQYYLSLGRERVGRDDERLVLTMWAVSVLLGLVHVTAEPILHNDPQLPAEGLVRVLQAMFVPGLLREWLL